MSILRGILAIAVVLLIAWLISFNKKTVRWKNALVLFLIMFVLAFLSLKTDTGIKVLNSVSNFFSWLLEQAQGGIEFVFGGIQTEGFVFFFNVLMPIVFISALIGILQYTKILPVVAKGIGWLINKITGMGEVESFAGLMTSMLGQPNSLITIEGLIPKLSRQQTFTIALFGLTSVSASTLGSYMEIVDGKFVLVAVLLNLFGTFAISAFMNPYDPKKQDLKLKIETESDDGGNFFSVLSDYISSGFGMAVGIGATLIGFMALITFLNNSFDIIFGLSFTEILGYVFSPLAWLMGIPSSDIVEAGSVMATKLLGNEFVALDTLTSTAANLAPKSIAMLSTYAISFSNMGTWGMIYAGFKSMGKEQGKYIAKDTLRLIAGSVLVSMLSAGIVGIFY